LTHALISTALLQSVSMRGFKLKDWNGMPRDAAEGGRKTGDTANAGGEGVRFAIVHGFS